MIISRLILSGMRNVLDKVVEEIKTHILIAMASTNPPPPTDNRTVYEIMWNNIADADR
jgi:hypothetical protein